MKDILFRKTFVDHIPKSLGSGFRRKGKAALFHILHLTHYIQGKGIDTKRRQRDIHCFRSCFLNEIIYKFF